MLVLEGLVGLDGTVQLQLFGISGWGIDLDYCDMEWFVLETNRDHSVVFEIASKYSKYCISDTFVDHDGYSISSNLFNLYITYLSLFNLYAEYMMGNVGLDEAQVGIKIARKNFNNLRYAEDTTLIAHKN